MFLKAIPVYAQGKAREKNTHIVLRAARTNLRQSALRIAAASFYRVWVNGRFVGFGPARAAGGYARVDRIDLSPYADGDDELIVEVAGYACRSLSTVYQPSFVCAEVCRGEQVLLATGDDFAMYIDPYFVQHTERFSMQRHFGEITDKRTRRFAEENRTQPEPMSDPPSFLPRGVPMPEYRTIVLNRAASAGCFTFDPEQPCRANRYSEPNNPNWGLLRKDHWGVFEENQIPFKPFRWVQQQKQQPAANDLPLPLILRAGEYAIFDLGRVETGFLQWTAQVQESCDVVLAWSESSSRSTFEFMDINCQNVTEHFLPEGPAREMMFEPNTCRTAALFVKTGVLTVETFGICTYQQDMTGVRTIDTDDAQLQGIYQAAVHTFAQNAVDIYMDCPSRERAGWLCDSYFTAAAEYFLLGRCDVESAFLENYRLYENNGDLPDGVLPMCYPSDFNGRFICQWNMWYVLQVRDFLLQRSYGSDREPFRSGVEKLLAFLAGYENSDGLLERLPNWNFVEWSTANEWVTDVNYPTNFLYCEVLRAAYQLYGDRALQEKAERLAAKLRTMAFDGEVFVDNAVRDENGVLRNTRNTSEAGQYYAVLFGGVDSADPRYDALNRHITDGFRAFAQHTGGRAFVPVNAFIGFYLRLKILMDRGMYDILLRDVKTFFGGMAAQTDTLWEYKTGKGSRNHGFASYAAVAIAEALARGQS